jgi:hypothetical protein
LQGKALKRLQPLIHDGQQITLAFPLPPDAKKMGSEDPDCDTRPKDPSVCQNSVDEGNRPLAGDVVPPQNRVHLPKDDGLVGGIELGNPSIDVSGVDRRDLSLPVIGDGSRDGLENRLTFRRSHQAFLVTGTAPT